MTRFQWYLIQWIEIENRAIAFLDRFAKRSLCFTIHSPIALNDKTQIEALLRFLQLEPRTSTPIIAGNRNRTPANKTVIGSVEEKECREVIERIPERFLHIFRDIPYSNFEWTRWLWK